MRVLVSGRRHLLIGVHDTLDRFIDRYIGDYDYTKNINGERHIFISGGAKGVDQQTKEWATNKNFIHINHPAEWGRWAGNTAGHFRNEEMLKYWRPNWLLAFLTPDSKGTRNMLDHATNERTRKSLALNILLIKYKDEDSSPLTVQESMFDLPSETLEWGDFIQAPF